MARTASRKHVSINYPLSLWFQLSRPIRFMLQRTAQKHYYTRNRVWLEYREDTYQCMLDILERRAHPFSTVPNLN